MRIPLVLAVAVLAVVGRADPSAPGGPLPVATELGKPSSVSDESGGGGAPRRP